MNEEFPEFSLREATDNDIDMDFDTSQEPKCGSTLLSVSSTERIFVRCGLPDHEWIHAVMNGHLGADDKGRKWTWNEDGADLVEG